MWVLTLYLSWSLPQAIAEVDGHPMYVDTARGQIHFTGFATKSECQAFVFDSTTFPVQVLGLPHAFTVTDRSCRKPRSANAAGPEEN